ncbi:hypothetical protein [Catellatospora sp. NPDC049609]|uniref:hypothetical protein n=1 Tax=Catellatospora sp. NPDC049609 TaxID=3155505 RepID=UPI0034314019
MTSPDAADGGPQQTDRPGRVKRLVESRPVQLLVAVFTAAALIVGFTNDMYGLFGGEPEPPAQPSALDVERASLLLAQEWPFQKAMSLRPVGEAVYAERIGWRAMLSIANTSATPMVVEDVETLFPQAGGNALRRVDRAQTVTVYPDRGDWIRVNGMGDSEQGDARVERAQPLPLILQPGQRILIEYEQAFEFWSGEQRARFEVADRSGLVEAIDHIVPMNRLDDGSLQCPIGVPFETVVRTRNGEIRKTVPYALLVAGCAIITGGAGEERMRTGDDPLGDGFPSLPS